MIKATPYLLSKNIDYTVICKEHRLYKNRESIKQELGGDYVVIHVSMTNNQFHRLLTEVCDAEVEVL